jgi:hypothetical protein
MPGLVSPFVAAGELARLEQPVLAGNGFVLRPWRAEDIPAVAAAYRDPAIQLWHARSLSLAEAAAWVGQWPGRWQAETGAGWAAAEGTKRGEALHADGWHDMHLHARLAGDPR